jgi:hypothetical protein
LGSCPKGVELHEPEKVKLGGKVCKFQLLNGGCPIIEFVLLIVGLKLNE